MAANYASFWTNLAIAMAILLAIGILAGARLAVANASDVATAEVVKTKIAAGFFGGGLMIVFCAAMTPSLFGSMASAYGSAFSGLPRLWVGGPVEGDLIGALRARVDGLGGRSQSDEAQRYMAEAGAGPDRQVSPALQRQLARVALSLAGIIPFRAPSALELYALSSNEAFIPAERDDHLGFFAELGGGGFIAEAEAPQVYEPMPPAGAGTGSSDAGSGSSGSGSGGAGTGGGGSGAGGGIALPDDPVIGRPPIDTPVSPPPPVPEPAAWLAMLAGFGMTGAALRHARRRFASAAY